MVFLFFIVSIVVLGLLSDHFLVSGTRKASMCSRSPTSRRTSVAKKDTSSGIGKENPNENCERASAVTRKVGQCSLARLPQRDCNNREKFSTQPIPTAQNESSPSDDFGFVPRPPVPILDSRNASKRYSLSPLSKKVCVPFNPFKDTSGTCRSLV